MSGKFKFLVRLIAEFEDTALCYSSFYGKFNREKILIA
jgi:hypothetical protein